MVIALVYDCSAKLVITPALGNESSAIHDATGCSLMTSQSNVTLASTLVWQRTPCLVSIADFDQLGAHASKDAGGTGAAIQGKEQSSDKRGIPS